MIHTSIKAEPHVLPFIGTAAEHLDRTEKRLQDARKAHTATKGLTARITRLKARCAALGAQNKARRND